MTFCSLLVFQGLLGVCYGYPIDASASASASESHWPWMFTSPVLAVVVLLVVVLFGCVCCRPGKGFQEFHNSSGARTSPFEFVNPRLDAELTIFPPLGAAPLEVSRPSQSHHAPLRPASFSSKDQPVSSQDWFYEPHLNFPRAQLHYIEDYGRGWFGRIVCGEAVQIRPEGLKTKVMVKILHEDATTTDQMFFLHEAKPHRDLTHPNIVQLWGRCLEMEPFLLLFESCPNGDLKTFLTQSRASAGALSEQGVLLRMARDVATGLAHMHAHRFVHTDLAARNCLLGSDLTVKIGDYGNAIELFPQDYYIAGAVALPVRWCAPETLRCTDVTIETKEVTTCANVWTLAVVVWEICAFGQLPYAELTDDQVIGRVLGDKSYLLSCPADICLYKEELYHLMKLCWKAPLQRPNVAQIKVILDNLVGSEPVAVTDFDQRWDQSKPNCIAKTDNAAVPLAATARGARVAAVDNHTPRNAFTDDSKFKGSESPRFRLRKSDSVQNLSGSLDQLNVLSDVSKLDNCMAEEEATLDSWLQGVEVNNAEDASLVRNISEAIRDLDLALAAEKTSSSEDTSARSSSHSSPGKESESRQRVLDFIVGGDTASFMMTPKSFELSSLQNTMEPPSLTFASLIFPDSVQPDAVPMPSLSDAEEEIWKGRLERGEFSEKVKEKSKSIADLMVLTHIDPSDESDEGSQDIPRNSLLLGRINATIFGSDSDIRHAVLEEGFQESLKRLSHEHKEHGHFDSLNMIIPDASRRVNLVKSLQATNTEFEDFIKTELPSQPASEHLVKTLAANSTEPSDFLGDGASEIWDKDGVSQHACSSQDKELRVPVINVQKAEEAPCLEEEEQLEWRFESKAQPRRFVLKEGAEEFCVELGPFDDHTLGPYQGVCTSFGNAELIQNWDERLDDALTDHLKQTNFDNVTFHSLEANPKENNAEKSLPDGGNEKPCSQQFLNDALDKPGSEICSNSSLVAELFPDEALQGKSYSSSVLDHILGPKPIREGTLCCEPMTDNTMDVQLNDSSPESHSMDLKYPISENSLTAKFSANSVMDARSVTNDCDEYKPNIEKLPPEPIINAVTNLGDGMWSEEEADGKLRTPDDERSSDSGFRDKGSLSESVEDACEAKYNLEDIEAELEEAFVKGAFDAREPNLKTNEVHFDYEESRFYEEENKNSEDLSDIEGEMEYWQPNDHEYFHEISELGEGETAQGWYVHPPDNPTKLGKHDVDDEFVRALRSELANKLPMQCRTFEQEEQQEEESDGPMINIEYTTVTPLEPILENSDEPRVKSPSGNRPRRKNAVGLLESVKNIDTETFMHYLDYMVENEGKEDESVVEEMSELVTQEEDTGCPALIVIERHSPDSGDTFQQDIERALGLPEADHHEPHSTVLFEDLEEEDSHCHIVGETRTAEEVISVDTATHEARFIDGPLPAVQAAFLGGMTPDSISPDREVSVSEDSSLGEASTDLNASPDLLSDFCITPDKTPFQSPRTIPKITSVEPLEPNNEATEIVGALLQLQSANLLASCPTREGGALPHCAIEQLLKHERLHTDNLLLESSRKLQRFEMSTSFMGEDEEEASGTAEGSYTPDWETGSDDGSSSSSGEFIWKGGGQEAQVSVKHAFASDPSVDQSGDVADGHGRGTDDDDGSSSDSASVTDFVPSAWDRQAAPAKSALRSPDHKSSLKKRRVWFKKEKYHCIYEYPREPSDTEDTDAMAARRAIDYSQYADWELQDGDDSQFQDGDDYLMESDGKEVAQSPRSCHFYTLGTFDAMVTNNPSGEDEEFCVSSSTRPFQSKQLSGLFTGSEFTASPLWAASPTTDRLLDDILPSDVHIRESGVEDMVSQVGGDQMDGNATILEVQGEAGLANDSQPSSELETLVANQSETNGEAELISAIESRASIGKDGLSEELGVGSRRPTRPSLTLDLPVNHNTQLATTHIQS